MVEKQEVDRGESYDITRPPAELRALLRPAREEGAAGREQLVLIGPRRDAEVRHRYTALVNQPYTSSP